MGNISATSVGIDDILFTARVVEGTGTGSDAVQRPLEVEAEGLVQERTTNAVLDPSEPAGEAVQFETSFPKEAVEGSARASVSIVGDLLGPTLDGLERLVRLPTGCGEQTMITFAPQVYVTGYLDAVNSLPAELQKSLEVEPTKLVLYFDEILEGETIELEAETVSPVANLQPTSSIVYEYYQPENQALAISRSDDSSGTFVREEAVDAEEAIDGRQIIDSAAGALAPKLFSAAAGAGIAAGIGMALV